MREGGEITRRTMLKLSGAAGAAALWGGRASIARAESGPIEHHVVFQEDGRFGGWPANHGIWHWGDEITFGYVEADHMERRGHTFDRDTARHMFARSLNGGATWSTRDGYACGIRGWAHNHRIDEDKAVEPADCPGGVDFTQRGFCLAFTRDSNNVGPSNFYYSTNRAHTWHGPFRFPDLDTHGVAARTDYIIDGPHEMLVFLTSAKSDGGEGRVFCARTTDGGGSWERVAWIGEEPEVGFAIMPSSVRLSDTEILTTMRMREGDWNYMAAYISEDNAATWTRLDNPVSDTGQGGSPPALVKLRDGRIAMAYAVRAEPARMCVRYSSDGGRSWTDERVLRDDDGSTRDMGYPRMVQRPDGKLVVVYYYNNALLDDHPPYRYIAATIFDPREV